jgi:hypothetical protein
MIVTPLSIKNTFRSILHWSLEESLPSGHSVLILSELLELLDHRINFGPSRHQDADCDPCISLACIDD